MLKSPIWGRKYNNDNSACNDDPEETINNYLMQKKQYSQKLIKVQDNQSQIHTSVTYKQIIKISKNIQANTVQSSHQLCAITTTGWWTWKTNKQKTFYRATASIQDWKSLEKMVARYWWKKLNNDTIKQYLCQEKWQTDRKERTLCNGKFDILSTEEWWSKLS